MSSFKLATIFFLRTSGLQVVDSPGILEIQLCVHLGIFVLKIGLKQSMIS